MWEDMGTGELAFVIGMGVVGVALLFFTVYATCKVFISADYREMLEESNIHSSPILGLVITGAICVIFFMPVVQMVKTTYLFHTYGIEGVASIERKVMENEKAPHIKLQLPLADGRVETLTYECSSKQAMSYSEGDHVPVIYLPQAPQQWILNERWARYLSSALKAELYLIVCCFAELMGLLCLVTYWPLPSWRARS